MFFALKNVVVCPYGRHCSHLLRIVLYVRMDSTLAQQHPLLVQRESNTIFICTNTRICELSFRAGDALTCRCEEMELEPRIERPMSFRRRFLFLSLTSVRDVNAETPDALNYWTLWSDPVWGVACSCNDHSAGTAMKCTKKIVQYIYIYLIKVC